MVTVTSELFTLTTWLLKGTLNLISLHPDIITYVTWNLKSKNMSRPSKKQKFWHTFGCIVILSTFSCSWEEYQLRIQHSSDMLLHLIISNFLILISEKHPFSPQNTTQNTGVQVERIVLKLLNNKEKINLISKQILPTSTTQNAWKPKMGICMLMLHVWLTT